MKNREGKKLGQMKKLRIIVTGQEPPKEKLRMLLKLSGRHLINIPIYIALIALSVVFIVPFFYLIGHSLMSVSDLINLNIKWLPRSFAIKNYIYAFTSMDYTKYLIRTVIVVALCVFGQIMSCAFVAYGLARIKFKLGGLIFALIIFQLIVPPQTIIVPSYILYSKFNWLNTFLPIIVPCFFAMGLNGGLVVFVFRQYYRTMPKELESAALIDGTGIFGAYFRIILPNAMPAALTTSILSLVWQWNNYFEPSIYISDVSRGTLTMQLQVLQSKVSSVMQGVDYNAGINLAATFLSILPILVIFFVLQSRFMKSLSSSGLAN